VYASGVRDPRQWLAELTRNVCLSHRRTAVRREALLTRFGGVPGEAVRPETLVERRDLLVRAMQAIDALPAAMRVPFIAYAFQGTSSVDLAQALGVSCRTVWARIRKARSLIRLMLEEGIPPVPDRRPERERRQEAKGERHESDSGQGDDPLDSLLGEIAARMEDTCVIQVPLPSGGSMEYHAAFEHGVQRREQRIKTLQAYVDAHPRGWKKRLELANLLLAANRTNEAEEQLRLVLKRQPRALTASLRLGELLVLSHRREQAIEVYEAAVAVASNEATRHHLRGLMERARSGLTFPQYAAEHRAEHLERAEAEFRAAIAAEPRNVAHYHELGLTYDAWGRPADALAAFDAALKVDPNDVYALARGHNPMTALGMYAEVLPRLERAVELDPNYTYAVKLLADRRAVIGLVRGREGSRTRDLVMRVLARDPDSADAMDALVRYYESRDEMDRAVAIWRDFLTRNPTNAKAWAFLGTTLERVPDIRAAADAYVRSQSLDPNWLDVYWRGWHTLTRTGQTERARTWLGELQRRFGHHWDAQHVIVQLMRYLGHSDEECLPYARRAAELRSDVPAAVWDSAEMLTLLGHPDEALELLERPEARRKRQEAETSVRNRLHLSHVMGRVLKALGREMEAMEWLREAERHALEARAYEMHYHALVGLIRMEMGDLDGAEEVLLRGLKARSWLARLTYAQLQERRAQGQTG
jgi:tetratricopeptide (TPR) repeat protein